MKPKEKKDIRNIFTSDICIIGAGIAGLVIADELKKSGLKINILEAGGEKHDYSLTKNLFKVKMLSYKHTGAMKGRYRVFGGSSIKWGGQLLPLNKIDFQKRSYIPNSGWPIKINSLKPFYRNCEELLGVNSESYGKIFSKKFFGKFKPKNFNNIKFRFSKWAPFSHRNLSKTLGRRCKKSKNIKIFLNTTATRIVLNKSNQEVAYIRALNDKKEKIYFKSNTFILAGGTFETVRLLLISKDINGKSIGDHSDLLGKYFHDHISIKVAEIKPKNRNLLLDHWSPKFVNSTLHTIKMEATEKWQREKKSLNVLSHIIYEEGNKSFINILREIYQSYQEGFFKIKFIKFRDIFILLKNIINIILISLFILIKKRKLPSNSADIFLYLDCEQYPNIKNQILLNDKKDEFNMNKLSINWSWSTYEIKALSEFSKEINREWENLNLGKLKWLVDFKNAKNLKEIIKDTYHPMGGTRMSNKKTDGVVDKNLKVHNIKNLYIASCSVFPTGGSSNPTMTLILLCLRLSKFLKNNIYKEI